LRVRLLARLAMELMYAPSPERKAALSQQAVEMARRVGDRAALGFALNARRYVIWAPDSLAERLAVARGLLPLARGERERELQGRRWLIPDLVEAGERAAVAREIEASARLAAELRQPVYLWYASVFGAMLALLEGRLDEAERLAGQAFDFGRRAQSG